MDAVRDQSAMHPMAALVVRPGLFFSRYFVRITTRRATLTLVAAGFFFAVAGSSIAPGGASLRRMSILFINGLGMAAIGAGISFLMATLFGICRYPFYRLWNLFALCSGAVMLLAWIPGAFMFTEPWKWWLIATGMVRGLGMKRFDAAITILFTFVALVMLVYAVLPVANQLGPAN